MNVLRWKAKYTHRKVLTDRDFLFNHNEEHSLMMMSPGLSIKKNLSYFLHYVLIESYDQVKLFYACTSLSNEVHALKS